MAFKGGGKRSPNFGYCLPEEGRLSLIRRNMKEWEAIYQDGANNKSVCLESILLLSLLLLVLFSYTFQRINSVILQAVIYTLANVP